MSVQAFAPNVFDENHQRLLESLAAQLASAVDNAQLTEKSQRQIERLKALHDIDQVINSSLDLQVILNILLDQVIEKLQVDAVAVLLLALLERAPRIKDIAGASPLALSAFAPQGGAGKAMSINRVLQAERTAER